MNITDTRYVLVGGILALVGKIVWDWLGHRKTNGHESRIIYLLEDMQERQKKMWECLERMEGRQHR